MAAQDNANLQPPANPDSRYRPNLPTPGKLDIFSSSIEDTWRRWKRQWDAYEIATRLDKETLKYRTAVLLTCLGSEALEIHEGFSFEDGEDRNNIETVLAKFDKYFMAETNEAYESYRFNKCDQTDSENVETYVTRLRQLAKGCHYGELSDRLIRDRIVAGVRDDELRKKLLEERDLTLKLAIEKCKIHESSEKQLKGMGHEDVHFVRKNYDDKKKEKQKFEKKGQKFDKKKHKFCTYCMGKHVSGKESCPAYGHKCGKCGRHNHNEKACKTEKWRKRVHACDLNASDEEDEFVVLHVNDDNINSTSTQKAKSVHANMVINEKTISFQIDSGATTNCMSLNDYIRVTDDKDHEHLTKTEKKLTMYNGTEVRPIGERILDVTNPKNDKKYKVRLYILEGNFRPILGLRAVEYMKLVTINVENIAHVKEEENLISGFDDVFKGELGTLPGELHVELDKEVPNVKLPCRKWPLQVREQVKEELDRLEKLEVIQKVDTPTDWISSLVVTMKPNGKARLCIDPKPLNKAIKRNHYPMKTLDDVLEELKGAEFFTKLDARNGFWHVLLDEESSFLTTFETPFGKYRWNRMPFGISNAPEEFQRRVDDALMGLPGVFAVHDDIIVWGKSDGTQNASENHDKNLKGLLNRCREKGMKLNREKVELKQTEITYLGHKISKDGVKADPKKVDAINKLDTPTDKQGVQRILGVVGYLQKFAPHLSEMSAPLRELIKKDVNFRWDEHVHGVALKNIKQTLSEPPVLRFFDPKSENVVIQCDASDFGLGACLLQDNQPVQYASRALTQTERNYAQIEKEMLAIVFGLERFERFVYGKHVEVESDHKPLEVIHKKALLNAPKRIQRMLLRTQKFEYTVKYKKGTEMYIADTLSRGVKPSQTIGNQKREDIFLSECEQEIEKVNMAYMVSVSGERMEEIRENTKTDSDLMSLMGYIQNGWPSERKSLPIDIQMYFTFREELSVQNGVIFKGERVVVPTSMRSKIIGLIHVSHTGVQGCLRRAREAVYWPLMALDFEEAIGNCQTCQKFQRNQQKEPMISSEVPELPYQFVGTDLFEFEGKQYLVTVDYYSDFFELDYLHNQTAKEVIHKLKAHFARHGIPETVTSDNGPCYDSHEFTEFAEDYGFEHVTSSPGYPQANGKAEAAVKSAKTLMKKAKESKTDPYLALLELRNIPGEKVKSSPAQRLFGRRTRTKVPVSKKLLKPKIVTDVEQQLIDRKQSQAKYYNRGTHELIELKPGQQVMFKAPRSNKWVKATVNNQVDIRSYQIRTEDGRVFRRNRRHLRTVPKTDILPRPATVQKQVQTPVQNQTRQIALEQGERQETATVETARPSVETPLPTVETATPTVTRQSTPVTDRQTVSGQTVTRVGRQIKKPKFYIDEC